VLVGPLQQKNRNPIPTTKETKVPSTDDECEIFSNYSWVRPIFELSNGIGTKLFFVEVKEALYSSNFHRWVVDNLPFTFFGTN
jgi:hypothetical protein